jgi:hypothetical protein
VALRLEPGHLGGDVGPGAHQLDPVADQDGVVDAERDGHEGR